MGNGRHLLLFAVLPLLVRCQKPQVSMSPTFKQVFFGDSFYLSCAGKGTSLTWYKNDTKIEKTESWKIAFAGPQDSGSYRCEKDGTKSDPLNISVLAFLPSASLTIETGHPVMPKGGAVILKLEHEDGLQGWRCWVQRGEGRPKKIVLNLKNVDVSMVFQTADLTVPETIYWCTDSNRTCRSNQITLRASDKDVSLEMYPLPAILGESLILRCVNWNPHQISHTVLYKDENVMWDSKKSTYEIPEVTVSSKGKYKCAATFTDSGTLFKKVSDVQEVPIHVKPTAAVLAGQSCSCPSCPTDGMSYRYYKKNGQSWVWSNEKPEGSSGIYRCRAVWSNMRSALSRAPAGPNGSWMIIVVVVIGLIIFAALGLFFWRRKRRTATAQVYEDVPLRSRGDDKYETLQKASGSEREYDTLHPEASGKQMRGGEYEPLRKDEMKEGVYHTLGAEGAAGGEGGYEALKKEGMKGGVYHTLGVQGAAGGEGGYEALKKEGMKEGVYHTLVAEGGNEAVEKKDKDSG